MRHDDATSPAITELSIAQRAALLEACHEHGIAAVALALGVSRPAVPALAVGLAKRGTVALALANWVRLAELGSR